MQKVSIKDFQKSDIRIGTVVKSEIPEWSHWVMKITVDFGREVGERTVFAGIMRFFKTQDLEGKQFPFVVNLEPKKIGPEGDMSEGMLMVATTKSQKPIIVDEEEVWEKPVLLSPIEKVPNGTRVN